MTPPAKLTMAVVAMVALVAAAFTFAGPAGAAPYGGGASIALSASTVAEGGHVTISGTGFEATRTVTLTLHTVTVSLGTAQTDASGAFSTTVTLPSGVTGSHTITAADAAGNSASATITITAPGRGTSGGGSGGSGGGVSATGVAVIGLSAVGFALLVGGALMLLAGRRRKALV
jgi:hypothetical protein